MAHHYLGNRMTADRTWMKKLGFELEDKGTTTPLWVVLDDCGGERPASLVEIVLWSYLTTPATPPDTRKPCTCDGAGRGSGRECVVQAGGCLGELWRCAKGNDGVKP